MTGMLQDEDGRCPWCSREAGPYDDCCRAKARWCVDAQLLAKRTWRPPLPILPMGPP